MLTDYSILLLRLQWPVGVGLLVSCPLHVQQRVGITGLIVAGSFVCCEAHVFIKAHGLRILLVDRDLADAIPADTVVKKLSPKSGAALPTTTKELA